MNIREVFEKCKNNDYVKDNNGKKWKVDKGDLTNNVGLNKVDVWSDRIKLINPDCNVIKINEFT